MTSTIECRQHQDNSTNTATNEVPRILCIDDDCDFQASLEMRLSKFNVQIEHAYHGLQGIAEAIHSLPDVILLDQAMPHGTGEYFLQVARRNSATCDIPIIVVTGMRDRRLKQRLIQAGATGFLQKPIRVDALVDTLRQFIELQPPHASGEAE